MDLALTGKVAIVTGGASGIGRASAGALAGMGAAVLIADIDGPRAHEAADELTGAGLSAIGAQADVAEATDVERVVELAASTYGGVDILLNNAAMLDLELRSQDTDVVDIPLDIWDRTIAVNLRGAMLGCRFVIPHMLRRGGGSIIMTSSAAASLGDLTRCAYGVSKGGLDSLVRYVATAFGRQGIRCNAVAPGVVLTPAVAAAYPAELLAKTAEHYLRGTVGEPDEVAAVVAFLASDAAALITGSVIQADGGLSAHQPTYAETASRSSAVKS